MAKDGAKGPWAGVDVGGKKKGFHLAVIEGNRVTELERYPDAQTLASHLIALKPEAIGIDSPSDFAPPGQKSRPQEREFAAKKICGIRYTPDRATCEAHPGTYYEWVFNGMELWDALRAHPHFQGRLFEVFPTAAWTIWHGPRGKRKREDWSQEALMTLPLQLPEVKWTQDFRDALGAAEMLRSRSVASVAITPAMGIVVPPDLHR
ncbi:MAG: DUF429 domain-containing protein [Solirubrobacterales bacterium]